MSSIWFRREMVERVKEVSRGRGARKAGLRVVEREEVVAAEVATLVAAVRSPIPFIEGENVMR
jgi:hypothetical protein